MLSLECIVYGKVGWFGYFYVYVGFALFSKFALLTLANFEKAWFGLDRIELAQCRLTVLFR